MLYEYIIPGYKAISPNNKGNNTVQQKAINWSKRILGKDALTHIKTKIIAQLFNPKLELVKRPLKGDKSSIVSLTKL